MTPDPGPNSLCLCELCGSISDTECSADSEIEMPRTARLRSPGPGRMLYGSSRKCERKDRRPAVYRIQLDS